MLNVDATICSFVFTNRSTDAFNCTDLFFDSSRVAQYNETNDALNNATLLADVVGGNFNVSFLRAYSPTDFPSGLDFLLTNGPTSFIYAFGPLNPTTLQPAYHGSLARGTTSFYVGTGLFANQTTPSTTPTSTSSDGNTNDSTANVNVTLGQSGGGSSNSTSCSTGQCASINAVSGATFLTPFAIALCFLVQ